MLYKKKAIIFTLNTYNNQVARTIKIKKIFFSVGRIYSLISRIYTERIKGRISPYGRIRDNSSASVKFIRAATAFPDNSE